MNPKSILAQAADDFPKAAVIREKLEKLEELTRQHELLATKAGEVALQIYRLREEIVKTAVYGVLNESSAPQQAAHSQGSYGETDEIVPPLGKP